MHSSEKKQTNKKNHTCINVSYYIAMVYVEIKACYLYLLGAILQ